MLKSLLKEHFSEKGSNSRREEEASYIYFCCYLEDLEGLVVCIDSVYNLTIN